MKGWLRPAPPSRTRAADPRAAPCARSAARAILRWSHCPPPDPHAAAHPSSADTDAMVARVAPAVLGKRRLSTALRAGHVLARMTFAAARASAYVQLAAKGGEGCCATVQSSAW